MNITPVASTLDAGPNSSAIDTTNANLLVVWASSYSGDPTITDSKGNSWTPLPLFHSHDNNVRGRGFYCNPASVGPNHTVTVGGGVIPSVGFYAFKGAHATDPLVMATGNSPASSETSTQPGSVTPSESGCLVITGVCNADRGAATIDAPFEANRTSIAYAVGLGLAVGVAFEIQTAPATRNQTWSWVGGAEDCSAIAVFRSQGGVSLDVSPVAIPNNHSGDITLNLTGTGTAWDSTTVFTPSGVSGVAKVSQNVTSATEATIVVTTGAGTGTLTITETVTGSAVGTTTVAVPVITIANGVGPRVYQRIGAVGGRGGSADVTIHGTYIGDVVAVEWSSDGMNWNTLDASPTNGTYTGTASLDAGQYTVSVRFSSDAGVSASVALVCVGDLVGIAGQSNAAGQGVATAYVSVNGLKAFKYRGGSSWADCVDPVTPSAYGSPWPALATHIMAHTRCPVAFIPFGVNGTSITLWQPGQTCYANYTDAATQAGGPLVTLWWQGESDALTSMSQATYESNLNAIADDLASLYPGHKLIPCRLQNSTGIDDAAEEVVRQAVDAVVVGNANVEAGPDLSDILSDDAYHIGTAEKMQVVASRWWTALYKAKFAG